MWVFVLCQYKVQVYVVKTSMSSDIWTKSKPDYFVDYTKTVDAEDVLL